MAQNTAKKKSSSLKGSTAAKKSVWRRYYKSGSISNLKHLNRGLYQNAAASAKLRAKLRRLAEKFSTVSANSVSRKDKPDYDNLIRRKSVPSKKIQSDGMGTHEPIRNAEEVSDDRNNSDTKVPQALNNTGYSETVYDDSQKVAVSDGRGSVLEKSDIRMKWQGAAKTDSETETSTANSSSLASTSVNSENATRVNVTRKRRFDVASNMIPTIPRPMGTGYDVMFQRPDAGMERPPEINAPDGYIPAEEGGRRISRNERYSKVGRDPPVWVPVEPILGEAGEPILREPVNKDSMPEEPYEPIPPLAKNDMGFRNGKAVSEPERILAAANRTARAHSVRRRPEAKEGGPTQLGKIASPLELKWIHAAETAASADGISTKSLPPPPAPSPPQRNKTAQKSVVSHLPSFNKNRTELNLHHQRGVKLQTQSIETSKLKAADNDDDCAPSSWKNIQLIQDSSSGGYFILQARTRNNCSHLDVDKSEKRNGSGSSADVNVKLDKNGQQEHSSGPAKVYGNLPAGDTDKIGWMLFGLDGKQADSTHQPSNGINVGENNFPKSPVNPKDTISGQIQPKHGLSEAKDLSDLVRYYVVGHNQQEETAEDSASKHEMSLSIEEDRTVDKERIDLVSNPADKSAVSILSGTYKTVEDVNWKSFPAWRDTDDAAEKGVRVLDQSKLGQGERESGSQLNDGKLSPESGEISAAHTTPEAVPAVVLAAFHGNTGSHVTSISGQSITWGTTDFLFFKLSSKQDCIHLWPRSVEDTV